MRSLQLCKKRTPMNQCFWVSPKSVTTILYDFVLPFSRLSASCWSESPHTQKQLPWLQHSKWWVESSPVEFSSSSSRWLGLLERCDTTKSHCSLYPLLLWKCGISLLSHTLQWHGFMSILGWVGLYRLKCPKSNLCSLLLWKPGNVKYDQFMYYLVDSVLADIVYILMHGQLVTNASLLLMAVATPQNSFIHSYRTFI